MFFAVVGARLKSTILKWAQSDGDIAMRRVSSRRDTEIPSVGGGDLHQVRISSSPSEYRARVPTDSSTESEHALCSDSEHAGVSRPFEDLR